MQCGFAFENSEKSFDQNNKVRLLNIQQYLRLRFWIRICSVDCVIISESILIVLGENDVEYVELSMAQGVMFNNEAAASNRRNVHATPPLTFSDIFPEFNNPFQTTAAADAARCAFDGLTPTPRGMINSTHNYPINTPFNP